MKKKRVFIACHYMELGGAEVSLIGLLKSFDYSRFDVDLFVWSHQGELMQYIPREVHLIPEVPEYAQIERPIKGVIRAGFVRIAFARMLAKLRHKIYMHHHKNESTSSVYGAVAKAAEPLMPSLDYLGEYDMAINYIALDFLVKRKIKAKKRVAWIHTDYSTVKVNAEKSLAGWDAFDYIVSISTGVTQAFLQTYPSLRNKVVDMENVLSTDFVRQRSEEITIEQVRKEMPKQEDVVNLLSVGRFCEAKNYDNVPDICRRINCQLSTVNCQFRVRWYIIGFGGDEALIRQKIAEAGMGEYVIVLGKRTNPYPYIKACDIYVQPSRYEGKSVSVREAQMLCKPVIVTNYLTARGQVTDGVDGIIVPMDNQGCAEGIAKVILNKSIQVKLTDYMKSHDFSNRDLINKLYDLI
jgi:glycosyltransferase involved in cell wall biosynthesis